MNIIQRVNAKRKADELRESGLKRIPISESRLFRASAKARSNAPVIGGIALLSDSANNE